MRTQVVLPLRVRGGRRSRLVGVVLLILVVVHLVSSKKAKPAPSVQVVSAAAATLGEMPETLNELGTVTPIATVNVLPQLSGYLTAVGYHEGEDVAKGQFLAQIDPRQFQISKQQAEAQLAKDQATLSQARSDLVRFTQLNQQKSIAEQTFVDQKFLVQQDEAAVEADRANIAQFDLDLIYCHITAPVAGRVGLRLVDPGNYVTQSTSPGIVTITTMKPTTVEFTVPQNALSKVLERFNSGAKLAVTVYNSDNTTQLSQVQSIIGQKSADGILTVTEAGSGYASLVKAAQKAGIVFGNYAGDPAPGPGRDGKVGGPGTPSRALAGGRRGPDVTRADGSA